MVKMYKKYNAYQQFNGSNVCGFKVDIQTSNNIYEDELQCLNAWISYCKL